jgi:hypothetical protein
MPRPSRPAAVVSLSFGLATCLMLPSHPADAQVRRCTAADGTSVFTDRRCTDVDSVARLPDARSFGGNSAQRGRCARSVQELIFEMTLAFDSGDANRLASFYHWAGMSSRTGYAAIERLDAMVHRPLVDIVPIMPSPPEPEPEPVPVPMPEAGITRPDTLPGDVLATETTGTAIAPRAAPGAPSTRPAIPTSVPPSTPPLTTVRQRPVGLRVEQTLSNGSTPSRTEFGLTRHFGCWWING